MLIPRKIHYCWFGGKPLPKSAQKCIDSWKKYFPDYEIIRWDESNFDVNSIPYTSEAYARKKYAFVSDYARFLILYQQGGLYFDTDVEIIRSFQDIVDCGGFMGCEHDYDPEGKAKDMGVNPGLGIASLPEDPLFKEVIEDYKTRHFIKADGSNDTTTIVEIVTSILCLHGLKNEPGIQEIRGIKIYPVDYFCPKSTVDGKLRLTENTCSIHHYDQSWQSPVRKYGRKLILSIGGHKLKEFLKPMLIKK